MNSADLEAKGLAVVSQDIQTGIFYIRYGSEDFELRSLCLDNGRPNRCMRVFEHDGIRVARIEEVRQAQRFQNYKPYLMEHGGDENPYG